MEKLTVVAKVVAKKECVASVRSELLKLLAPTRQEAGCLEYLLHQDGDDPAVFIFYETWQSPDCLEKHMNSDHFTSYVKAVGNMLEEKIVHKMTRIEQGA